MADHASTSVLPVLTEPGVEAERVRGVAGTRSRVWPVLAVVATFYAVTVGLRLAQHDILWFVHFSPAFLEVSTAETTPGPEAAVKRHYDGQYYWAVAVDPLGARDYIPPEIAGYVYSRALYPAVVRASVLGSEPAVPWAMLVVNLLAVVGGTCALAAWLRARLVSPWYALVFGLYPGLVFAVVHDLTEPLAYGLVVLAALAWNPRSGRRLWAAAALLALAVLARETTVFFAFVAAVALLWPVAGFGVTLARRMRLAALFLAAVVAPLLAWRAFIAIWLESPTQERWDGLVSLIPFYGISRWWPWVAEHQLVVGAVILPTLVALAGLPSLIRSREGRLWAGLLILNAAAFVVFLPSPVNIDYRGAGRAATGVMLATLFCLPLWRQLGRRLYGPVAVLSWSIVWFMVVAMIVGRPGYSLITS